MNSPLPANTSGTARLMIDAPSFAVGWQEPVYVPNPAVGGQWAYTVDGRYCERLLAVTHVFTTSAVVGNRYPAVNLADVNGRVITSVPGGGPVVASSVKPCYLTGGGPAYGDSVPTGVYGFIPDLLIPGGWSWQSSVLGMDAGDEFTGVVLLVQRFPNDATQITAGG